MSETTKTPTLVPTPHLKAGLVACYTDEQVRIARGMDDFAAWIRGEVRG